MSTPVRSSDQPRVALTSREPDATNMVTFTALTSKTAHACCIRATLDSLALHAMQAPQSPDCSRLHNHALYPSNHRRPQISTRRAVGAARTHELKSYGDYGPVSPALLPVALGAKRAFRFDLQRFAQPARLRPELSELMTMPAREMAEVLGVHEKTVLKWARERRVPCVRVGRTVRFLPAEVLAALARGATKEASGDE